MSLLVNVKVEIEEKIELIGKYDKYEKNGEIEFIDKCVTFFSEVKLLTLSHQLKKLVDQTALNIFFYPACFVYMVNKR